MRDFVPVRRGWGGAVRPLASPVPFTGEAAGRIAAGGEGSAITAQKPANSLHFSAGPNLIGPGMKIFVLCVFCSITIDGVRSPPTLNWLGVKLSICVLDWQPPSSETHKLPEWSKSMPPTHCEPGRESNVEGAIVTAGAGEISPEPVRSAAGNIWISSPLVLDPAIHRFPALSKAMPTG